MSPTFGAAGVFSVHSLEIGLIRWFADLPIERKLRIVIGAPAIAAFTLAVIVPIVTNVLHSREELRRFATRVAAVTGVNVIEALEAGDDKGAVKALHALREEPEAASVEIALPDGRPLATYRRGADGAPEVELDPLSKTLAAVKLPAPAAFDPRQRPTSSPATMVVCGSRPPRSPTARFSAWCESSRRSMPSIPTGSPSCSRPSPDWPRR